MKRENKKKVAGITLKAVVLLFLFIVCCVAFGAIAHEIIVEKEGGFDDHVFKILQPLNSKTTTSLMKGFTFFGSYQFLLPAYLVIVVFFLLKRKQRFAIDIAVIGILSTVMLQLFKFYFQRARPVDPLVTNTIGFSFPSGHSFCSFTFFGLIIYIIIKTTLHRSIKWLLSILCFFTATIIAFSRVYLHVHYASDVLAGFLLAIVWLMLSFFVLNKINKKQVARA